jgi:arylsulfatase A-like enzyme
MRSTFRLLFIMSLAQASFAASIQAENRPNVILIMVDDMGYSDLSCYGSDIQTPNLDRLADHGLKFRQLRTYSRCCPSRASLLTGRYAHEVELGWMTAVDEQRPGYRGGLTRDLPTIAELLRPQGYATHMIGKWHLAPDSTVKQFFEGGSTAGTFPTDRGFDSYYGIIDGASNSVTYDAQGRRVGGGYFTPWMLVRQTRHIPIPDLPENFFLEESFGDELVRVIESHPDNQPFFIYHAPFAPHNPVEAPEARVAPLRERYRVGYDVLWKQRIARMENLGLFPQGIDAALAKPFFEKSWEALTPEEQVAWIERAANYAALVQCVDEQIGRAIDTLEARGLLDNTLVLFLSDNGATKQGCLLTRLHSNLANAPFREFKSSSYEGGVSSPLVMSWPDGVPARPGFVDARAHISDIAPTILAAAGVEYPQHWGLKSIPPLESQNLLDPEPSVRPLFFEHESTRAAVIGDWKIVSGGLDQPWELYNLRQDPFERNNLASSHPDMLAQLEAQWNAWAGTHQVLPLEPALWGVRIKKYTQ